MSHVLEAEIPVLQIALSLLSPPPQQTYQLEMLFAESTGEGMQGAWPAPLGVASFHPREPTADEWDTAIRHHAFLSANKLANTCASILSKAFLLDHIAGHSPEAMLLEYFKVIEVIAQGIDIAPPRDFEHRQSAIVDSLHSRLKSRKNVSKKVRAIFAAEVAIKRLDRKYLSLKVEAVADELRMSDEWLAAALEFVETRNRYLSHGGTKLPQNLAEKLCDSSSDTSAQAITRSLLSAYINSV
jgi:hypothetical protein